MTDQNKKKVDDALISTTTSNDELPKDAKEELARKRAKDIYDELIEAPAINWLSSILWKKIALVLLVLIEICIFLYLMNNTILTDTNNVIVLILFVIMIFTFILILGNVIVKEERELAKAKAEMLKEVFMRRLK